MSILAPVPNTIKTAMPFVGLCSPSIQCIDMIAERCRGRIWPCCQEFERVALRMMKCGYIHVECWTKNKTWPVLPVVHRVRYGRIASPTNTLE